MNYYNEIDPFCAAWLRNLIDAELIPTGDVDERSIKDVTADDLEGYTQCHFFAGIGGWPLALQIAGWPDDLAVWTGSCPCQPFSQAGKRKGTADERHLWPELFRLVRECRPATIFGEQVASGDGLGWLDGVFADLEGAGYSCGAADLCAAGVGAPHIRQRLYWVAKSNTERHNGREDSTGARQPQQHHEAKAGDEYCGLEHAPSDGREQGRAEPNGWSLASGCGVGGLGDTSLARLEGRTPTGRADERATWVASLAITCRDSKSRRVSVEPGDEPLAHGIPVSMGSGRTKPERMAIRAARANRTGRLRGYGNAIVPEVAAEFIRSVAAHNESEA